MRMGLPLLGRSLRGRLLVGTLVWILATVAVAGWGLNALFRQHLERQLDTELRVYINQLVAGLSVGENETATLTVEPSDPRFQQPLSGLYWQVNKLQENRADHPVVAQSRSLWDQTLDVSVFDSPGNESELILFPAGNDTQMYGLSRVVTPPEGQARYQLTVAADERVLARPLKQFTQILLAALAVLVAGMVAATFLQLWLGVKPLIRMREELAKVRAGVARQISGHYPSEVQPLVKEFNQVLRNNDEIVQRARTQAGNLAHALKTPLSVLANAAQQDNSQLAAMVGEQVSQAQRQVNYHLARARAAAIARTPGISTPVLPIVEGLLRTLEQLYRDKNIRFYLQCDAPQLAFLGGEHDLQEMLGNVLDNACKWAVQHVWITVVAMQAPDQPRVVINVEDDGQGLPESDQARAFQRGTRLDEQTSGSGLGLAIVQDLVQTYGGKVCACTSVHGGLSVELILPGALLDKSLNNKSYRR
ncbi:MAG TPA: ATP-binding protein [Pusillimonas sp.]|nr:ATP-binding protein [Pusillimonas sp.]